MTLSCYDQWQRHGGDINGGLGWDHISGSSVARGDWTFDMDVVKGWEEVGRSDG